MSRGQTKDARAEQAGDGRARVGIHISQPPEALISLLHLERAYLPRVVWDPFAGDGAITNLMRSSVI